MTVQLNNTKESLGRPTPFTNADSQLISLQFLETIPQINAANIYGTKEETGKLFEMISNILIKLDGMDDLVHEERKMLNTLLSTMLSLTITNWLEKIN